MDNITFTTEQKEQLKNNVRAIERYIEENVVPYITGDVRLEFGGIYHCPRTGSPTAMYTFYVDINNCPWATKFIKDNELGEFTGKYGKSGFCVYPLYKFNLDKIKEVLL